MNGENNRPRDGLLALANYVICIALSVGSFTLGAMLKGQIPFAGTAYAVCAVALLLCVVVSGVGGRLYAKKVGGLNVRQANAQADERMARLAKDGEREWKRIRRACVLSCAYIALLWALSLLLPFFYGAAGYGSTQLFAILLCLFFQLSLMGKCLRTREKPDPEGILPEAEFPQLYAMVRQVGQQKLKNKKLAIRVMDDIPDRECSAAVLLHDDCVTFWIGAVLLCVADEGELRQVILHEFAHMDGADMHQDKLYGRVMGYLTASGRNVFAILADTALMLPVAYLSIEGQLYFLFSSREKESRADDAAANLGDRQKQASVLAKIHAHDLYAFEQEPYECIFASEQLPQHLLTDRARAYREALTRRGGEWRRILENELPSRVATHPTFRQRWEALGCCDYDLTPAPADTEFTAECWAAAETADASRASLGQERYAQLRQEAYLDKLAIAEEFESCTRELTPDELRPPMLAYYQIGRPDKMEALCDEILEKHDSPYSTAFARYWKGTLLLHRYDDSGLPYVYQAMEVNSNYIDEGLELIGRYCTRMGLAEELEEYRRRAPELMQLKKDRQLQGITAKAKLSEEQLPEGWLERICGFIRNAAGEDICCIYLVKETVTEDYAPSSFVLRLREETPEARAEEIYDKVFRLLDDWPEDWDFCLYLYEASMEKPLKQVPGSCVWPLAGGEDGHKTT